MANAAGGDVEILKYGYPPEPLPEEEELRAWARGERDVQDWQDRIPDEDILELD